MIPTLRIVILASREFGTTIDNYTIIYHDMSHPAVLVEDLLELVLEDADDEVEVAQEVLLVGQQVAHQLGVGQRGAPPAPLRAGRRLRRRVLRLLVEHVHQHLRGDGTRLSIRQPADMRLK